MGTSCDADVIQKYLEIILDKSFVKMVLHDVSAMEWTLGEDEGRMSLKLMGKRTQTSSIYGR